MKALCLTAKLHLWGHMWEGEENPDTFAGDTPDIIFKYGTAHDQRTKSRERTKAVQDEFITTSMLEEGTDPIAAGTATVVRGLERLRDAAVKRDAAQGTAAGQYYLDKEEERKAAHAARALDQMGAHDIVHWPGLCGKLWQNLSVFLVESTIAFAVSAIQSGPMCGT